jgi:hypothetical protein
MGLSSQSDIYFGEPDESQWFVYLLPLFDDTSFKVGFSCHPMQRMYSFTRRYFDHFDLRRALLLRVPTCTDARAVEALVKVTLAPYRAQAPEWSLEAGGFTEWFAGESFEQAQGLVEEQLPLLQAAELIDAMTHIRGELTRMANFFGNWACDQARRIHDAWHVADQGWHAPYKEAQALRDWVDAYRYFDVPLLADDPEAAAFVRRYAYFSA